MPPSTQSPAECAGLGDNETAAPARGADLAAVKAGDGKSRRQYRQWPQAKAGGRLLSMWASEASEMTQGHEGKPGLTGTQRRLGSMDSLSM